MWEGQEQAWEQHLYVCAYAGRGRGTGLSWSALVHMLQRMAGGTLVCQIYYLLARVQLSHIKWVSTLPPT